MSEPFPWPTTEQDPGSHTKGLAAVFTKGNKRYMVVALTALAGVLASLGGGWFDGS